MYQPKTGNIVDINTVIVVISLIVAWIVVLSGTVFFKLNPALGQNSSNNIVNILFTVLSFACIAFDVILPIAAIGFLFYKNKKE